MMLTSLLHTPMVLAARGLFIASCVFGSPLAIASGEDGPTELQLNVPHEGEFGGETDAIWFQLLPSERARSLAVVVSAECDVDLYLSRERLDRRELPNAELVENGVDWIETAEIHLPPPSAGRRVESIQVWVVAADRPQSRRRFQLWAWENRADSPVLARADPTCVRVGLRDTPLAVVYFPRFCQETSVRAEGEAGILQLRRRATDATVPSIARGTRREWVLGSSGGTAAGLWEVISVADDAAPGTADALRPRVRAVYKSLRPPNDAGANGAVALDGTEGSLTVSLGKAGIHGWVDVTPRDASVVVTWETSGDPCFAFAEFGRPVSFSKEPRWSFTGDVVGPKGALVIGGTEPAPIGRYWFRIPGTKSVDAPLVLRWSRRTVPALEKAPGALLTSPMPPTPFKSGPGAPPALYRFARRTPLPKRIQVFDARRDVELLLKRADTGEVIARAIGPVRDESMVMDESSLDRGSDDTLLELVARDFGEEQVTGRLLVSDHDSATLPPEYLPPFAWWNRIASERYLAATVMLESPTHTCSGTIVGPGGVILTVLHGIAGADSILVWLPTTETGSARQLFRARILRESPAEDLALVAITEPLIGSSRDSKPDFPHVSRGRPEALRLGDEVRALGYGEGGTDACEGTLNLLKGSVSALERVDDRLRWIVADHPTTRGMSGGGLFDANGNLVAIAARGGTGRLSFAVPASRVPDEWWEIAAGEARR